MTTFTPTNPSPQTQQAPTGVRAPGLTPTGGVPEVDAGIVRDWLERGEAVLVDVREPDEHARERIGSARLVALSRFDPALLPTTHGARLVLHCKGGKRSAEACRLALAAGVDAVSLAGGIEAWKAAGLPVASAGSGTRISVMRQVQMVVGGMVLVLSVLALVASPLFAIVPALMGAGLIFAGVTGTCALASVLSRMPWNRLSATTIQGPGASCGAGRSCSGLQRSCDGRATNA